MAEDHRDSSTGALGHGPVRECQLRYHTGPAASFIEYPSVDKLPTRRISAGSKRQTCVSHSALEVELVAADFGLRADGLPSEGLWHDVFPHQPPLLFHEDNQAMIRVVTTGQNPTMRYTQRAHRVSVAWLHDVCAAKKIQLVYEDTSRMCVDISTKGVYERRFMETCMWSCPY